MAQRERTLDLIAIGRSSVDLYGQQVGGRLEDMGSFAKYVGGSPTNTMVGASRLGLKAGLVTRIGADHMGRFIREELEREGVDVRGVGSDPERLTALVILGIRDRDTFPLLFYRENCADMALDESDIDPDYIASAACVLLSGTHLSRANVFAASFRAAEMAKQNGAKVALDIDYRPVLWGLEARDKGENRFVADERVTGQLQRVLPLCDLVVGTEEEIHILGGATDTIAALRAIRTKTSALVVLKLGAQGCAAFPGTIPDAPEEGVVVNGFPVEVYNVLGAGDAFMAGFLRGWLRNEKLERCCELANASGAIVVSRHGCAPAMPTWAEMQHFLAMKVRPHRLREAADLEHLHWVGTRRGVYDELTVLAVDHRTQFEDLARSSGAGPERIAEFKRLAVRAAHQLAKGDPRFGVLIDGRHGMRALEMAADLPYWIGRPIELPQSCPIEFDTELRDVGAEIAQWPLNHTVKCLFHYHPDDEEELRKRQERQALRLFDACRATRHELLVEIIASKNAVVNAMTAARAIQRFYDIGVRPDWWKLEPAADAETWANIERAILANDPHCRGVVLLGLSVPQDELVKSFAPAARAGIVKGFAVGRTIFNGAAEQWFKGEIDDAAAIEALSSNLSVLVEAWRRAKKGRTSGP
ncbi:MAG TPA: 5-dehydro-2-deoxygluconokinase [Vitreimonas sp.]|uniref:bifunctional 5-dehydro-2-deoxygluconokinase/5-dehydro-2- deoxyphosphogluconate aldolase n=1 Tax=Vitreimonas sp. TaxID=3069702 RepID=UPI002D6C136F|nr:5-dehydro-2-deoxygluconokinase [Vitreimonas sp.]HYD88821.1 5-dehydro-2-deoxygluconokinase [Vitreimonas sp.]